MVEKRKWGRWWLDDTSPPSLNFPMPWYTYEIVLSRCRTVNERRLWLEHMAIKRYINRQDLIDLRCAFDDLVASGLLPAANASMSSQAADNVKLNRCKVHLFVGGIILK